MVSNELLSRGIEEIFTKNELKKVLSSSKKIKIYYGVDPSGSIIHLGHAVVLRKLRDFQKLGHKIIFLIGDFTGMIGDPTDRNGMRKPLIREQVLENAESYKEQASKFLNFTGKNPAVIRYNSEWNDRMDFKKIIELSAHFTVQQLLQRDMFEKRIKEDRPIHLHEFLYPVIQGYDAVALDADAQFGGTDQTFNMLAGRQLAKQLNNKIHTVLTFKLLEGTDGRKMSKSFNNYIGVIDLPFDMYGKIMSMKDHLIPQYLTLASDMSMAKVNKLIRELNEGANPKDIKAKLAFEIVKELHSEKDAKNSEIEFKKVFANKEIPSDIPTFSIIKKEMKLIDLLLSLKLVQSKSDARRLVEQGAVDVDGTTIYEKEELLVPHKGMIIKVGKRRWAKII
ncbi:tyrosine--tRNA ligase [bacterium CG_4_10_14_0_2_um_filter_33_32]|nr:MAG: tyrosine--tRNA ligase [bacterium CG2_30_33_46]PIR67230.1 MAG: tyrosine--tRNA ligase [bacterium CG10_big_fil_rev_8_21_14_0_10_33_18]PIU77031.1 MAG: tyrosine--tRNA ligase [bacterium CG06_land_8_20_14_3_00_33_50]PIW81331.1 MAG: tyrosine--tRNA ligase [bacterium CG_4_8_14_3_um_filter_33_28]PIY85167.1 MAG: tyrosine--tRNA ligase [bacterium CG_4_10_14_0_8_um_filter_33_57]PIZ86478.1 MAG: tyrosine--tRNA ligase [bacterium CG_4_10_14_0_2_um_filter_33_32]PJA71796.1 MAG: tyrosine--tRNA ligase [bact